MSIKLTVFFEDPFWVGVFERINEGKFQTSKVTFGAEPKDYDVYDLILNKYKMIVFSIPIEANESMDKKINPKKLHKKIRKEVNSTGVGTKAQIAMKLQMEANKSERKKLSRQQKEEIEKQKFELRQQKKKMKKRGH